MKFGVIEVFNAFSKDTYKVLEHPDLPTPLGDAMLSDPNAEIDSDVLTAEGILFDTIEEARERMLKLFAENPSCEYKTFELHD